MSPELQHYVDAWKNESAYNEAFHAELTAKVNGNLTLNAHRSWVEWHQHGFGDRPFHYIWKMLVDSVPDSFSFLEIGVFKGQVLSLVELLAKESNKQVLVCGVTTLSPTPDTICKYPDGDYFEWIREIYTAFGIVSKPPKLFIGKSDDEYLVSLVKPNQPFDAVYIDAGHDYSDVCADIHNYAPMVKPGGFLIMDDASIGRLNIGCLWPGFTDVAKAVSELLDKDERYKFLLACGHINLFQRVKE